MWGADAQDVRRCEDRRGACRGRLERLPARTSDRGSARRVTDLRGFRPFGAAAGTVARGEPVLSRGRAVTLDLEEVQAARRRKAEGRRFAEEAEALSLSFRDYVRAGWHVLEPGNEYVSNWHIDAICDHLEAARFGQIRKLLINIPPRHMKSLTVSVFWPTWRWTFEPNLKFLTASHKLELAQRDATKSRDLLLSNWYRSRWPDVVLKGDVNRLSRYENTKTGYRIATHVGGGTGDGGDILILDDPHEATDAMSDAKRSAAVGWHGNTWASRFNDLKTGVEVVVMQRLHEHDLAGHLLESGRWTHLCLPARYEPKHPFIWPDDPRDPENEPVDGIDQGEGALLWPKHIPEDALDELASDMTEFVAAGQLQQRPAPREGAMLKRRYWRYYDPTLSFYSPYGTFGPEQVRQLPRFDRIVHSWDTSVKDRARSDFVSGQVWGCDGANRYLLRLFHQRAGLNATIAAMLELKDWSDGLWPGTPQYIIIEKAATGDDAAREIRNKVQGVQEPISVRDSKEVRAEAAGAALESHNMFLPGYAEADLSTYDPRTPTAVQAFVEELSIFNNGAHDDQVDAWSMMTNWSRRRPKITARMTTA